MSCASAACGGLYCLSFSKRLKYFKTPSHDRRYSSIIYPSQVCSSSAWDSGGFQDCSLYSCLSSGWREDRWTPMEGNSVFLGIGSLRKCHFSVVQMLRVMETWLSYRQPVHFQMGHLLHSPHSSLKFPSWLFLLPCGVRKNLRSLLRGDNNFYACAPSSFPSQ